MMLATHGAREGSWFFEFAVERCGLAAGAAEGGSGVGAKHAVEPHVRLGWATTDGDHNGRQFARRHVVCPPAAARRPRRPRRPSVRPSFEEAGGGGGGGRKHIKKEYCTPTCTHSMCRIHLSIHSRFK